MITKAIDILQTAKASGVQIYLEKNQLQLKFPKGKSIDPQLLEEIKRHRELIIHFLNDSNANTSNGDNQPVELLSIKRTPAKKIPLSYSQERLWFIDRLEGSVQYHMPSVLKLTGKLNKEALTFALKEIVNRHEIVRTVFREEDGQAYQHINPVDDWQLTFIDGSLYKADRDTLKHFIQQLINQPFDLSKDYMLRSHLISVEPGEHILVVTMHHIASDGWSRSVLVREVMELYRSFDEKSAAQIKPLPVQYAEYSIWQREYLSGENLANKLGYWKRKLEDVAPLQLPTDYTRPAVQSTKGAAANFNIDKVLADKLQEYSRQQGATLFMTLLAAFKVLLYRYTGQQDICVGSPVAGRQQQELEGLIGFFANTLALRTTINEDTSFTELLQQVRRTTMEAQEYQDVPFERVVDAVVKERSLSRTPLTQVLFALQNTPEIPVLKLGEIQFSKEGYEHTTAMFDISFFINDTVTGLHGIVEYSTELFNESTIVQMMAHFKALISSIIKIPQQKIGELPMLSQQEEELLLLKFNDNKVEYPANKNIISLFETQAAKLPGNTAFIFEEQRITYQELNEQSNQVAHYLISEGIQPEDLVPVCMQRGIQMVIGMLGILKAGAAYVPVDPEYPAERIRYVLEDSRCSIVLSCIAGKVKINAPGGVEILTLDATHPIFHDQPTTNPNTNINPNQLAYVIYTSGSTGNPKGVMIEHSNVYAFICWCRHEFASSRFDIVYASTSICFDLSVYELFFPLSIGKPVRIIENGLHIGKYLKGDRFVLTNSVPVVIENLLKEGKDLSNISVINMAGEPVPLHVQQALDTDRIEVRNLYGPTEDTTYSTFYRLKKYGPILIGKPISNSSVYILNKKSNLVPVGVAGEICIGGTGVARGYLNRPELTTDKFVPDHFSKITGALMYRTGDLGRWLPDGNIEYMGRIDDQVKIRGFRIELGEVEAALNDLEQVSSSCVVVKKHNASINTLVTYFIPDANIIKEKERELYLAQVASWKEVYEIEYEQTEGKDTIDEEFNIIGWNDSFTGQAIPAQQMSEWVNEVTDKILSLHPENVLEIGCGTGLIFFQLAGKVKKYIGTDFSRSSITQVSQRINKGLRDYGPASFFVAPAHEVSVTENENIDTIILNSIVQYFPGEEYMNDVISNSIGILKGKGRIIIGDVRDNRLLRSFKSRLQLAKMQQSVSAKEFNWAVDHDLLKEEELCLSPAWFYQLQSAYSEITNIDIQWKKASYINELSLYRYTVVLSVGLEEPLFEPAWLSLSGVKDQQQIQEQINSKVNALAIKGIPNPRLWKERQLAKALQEKTANSVSDLLAIIEKEDAENIAIREMLAHAVSTGYHYRYFVAEDPMKVNVLLELEPTHNPIKHVYGEPINNKAALTNIPLFTDISLLLQKDIRALLKKRLPEYMVPSEMIALARLPLNNNGKIDRKFLSDRKDIAVINELNYQPPGSELETRLALIWQDLLRIERVGILDNFFELGGHSLLVMRLISAVRRELAVELAIKDLFVYSTISRLAAYLEGLQSTSLVLPPVVATNRPDRIPLSFSQERLWFVDRLEGSVPFHVPVVLKLTGKLNTPALKYAIQTIVDRHEVLRTVFLEEDGFPFQFIKDKDGWELDIADATDYKSNEAALKERIKDLIATPFNLSMDHMLRANLLILSEEEYVLVVTQHHIASDAWSMGIMVNEVVELYKSFVEDKPVSLHTLDIQYADYAIWQRNYLTGELLNHKLNYWKTKLSGVEPLQLPTDFARPPLQSTKGTTAVYNIDKQLLAHLKELGQQQETTLFMTLLAAFKVLLHRYSGQQDICVGTSIAGRQQQETEGLIGFFVNILALRTQVDPAASFNALLEKVKQTTLEAYEHQEVPFEKVVDAVVKERDISRSPLFQALFVMLNTPSATETALGDLTLSGIPHDHTSAKYDITFFVSESQQGLSGSVEYSTELFSEQTILRMTGHFSELLHTIVLDPFQEVGNINLLTKTEQQQLLIGFNNTAWEYPRDITISELFTQQVHLIPSAIAVAFEKENITYAELHERSSQLANYLLDMGVQPATNIGLLSYRGIDMIICILGIVKAGCAYVPFNTDYPAERINYIIEDAAIQHVVYTSHDLLHTTTLSRLECIHINDALESSTRLPEVNTGIDSCAYIMFTSGTTGRPKGIAVSQRNIIKLVYDAGPIAVLPGDRVLQWSNYSFDGSTYDIYSSLLKGASLCMIRDDQAADVDELSKVLVSAGSTVCFITTALFNTFIDVQPTAFKGLRKILFGGEMVSMSHVKKALAILGRDKIVHVYGPTETTVYACSYAINEINDGTGIPIGKPLSNTSFFLLDTRYKPVPVGVPGELFIGGEGVALGYVNNPSLTTERFIQNPFNNDPGNRLYRTGDIVRWLPAGDIEYLGRIDDQVKIRGFRIELGEIESVLQECELVRHAAVLAKTDQEGTKRLIGYVVPNSEFDKEAIQTFLRNKLPDYMVPALLVEMGALPLNANSKIDRKALPDPGMVDIAGNEFVAPETIEEKVLATIWARLLDLEQVGIHDNFFEIGGDSLLAIRVVAAIRKELEIEMPISNLFEFQTISTLAAQLENQPANEVLPPIHITARPLHVPLSFMQERLWFIDKLNGSLQYHIPAVMRLKGKLNKEALQHSISELINRHEVLRTIFLEQDGEGYQMVKDKMDWELPVSDGASYNDDPHGLQRSVQQMINMPFDLSKDNMLRANLVTLNEQENVLVVTLHHIASDGWSRSIMVKEVVELYTAFEENRAPHLAPLPIQYADFSIWQRNYLQGAVLDKKLNYWREKLQDVEPLQMPTDFTRPAIPSGRGGSKGFAFDKSLTDALLQLSQQQGTTLFMTLQAALNVLLYRYSNQQDICTGTGIAGRQQQEVEGLIGFFVNTLALRTSVNKEDCFVDLLQRVRSTTLEAYGNQDVPFEKVVDSIIKKRDQSRNPIFQVMFVLQNTPEIPNLTLGNLQMEREGYQHNTAQFDLSFSITEYANGLDGSLEYNADLYTPATIDRMLVHFNQLVTSIVKAPQKKIGELSFMSKAEEKLVLLDFNSNETNYPADKTIITVFNEQAAANPQAIAIAFAQDKYTYHELNERANQLGHYLRQRGVREETLVAISIERSLNMIVAILGILKAGGAYVPIDAGYPADRIGFMLEDTAASVIITSNQALHSIPVRSGIEVINLDSDWHIIGAQSVPDVSVKTIPSSLAYVIYTSGSTGKPKGVMVTQQNVVSLVKEVSYVSLGKNDALLSTGSVSFDATTIEYWGMLLNGGKLVLCDEETLADTRLLKIAIDENNVNKMWFASSWFNQLVETDIAVFERLDTIMAGGEKLSEQHIQRLRQTYPHIELINGYGPTENTTFSITYSIKETIISAPIPIGRPLNNRKAYVLDEKLQLLPVGVPGEIYLGGAGLSKGYLNSPGLTAEKFVPDPFSKNDRDRIYKTGDMGRWLPGGNIEYLGRVDEQVKIRGYRIELGEIETVIQDTGWVKQAVVTAYMQADGNKSLAGYIVPTENYKKEAFLSSLQTKLPGYMIPALWVELERLPLTPNGKVNKRALPDPDETLRSNEQYVAPVSDVENQLVLIWQDILQKDRIGTSDNFFELGGHSLMVMRLISAVRKKLSAELAVKDLFSNPTIAALSTHLKHQHNQAVIPGIQAHSRTEPIPLSFSQERLWFIDQLEGSVPYNSPTVLRLKGKLDTTALASALREIINRHEVLRTVFYEIGGIPYQAVIGGENWKVLHLDGSGYKNDRAGMLQLVEQLIAHPFDLSSDYMLRAVLIALEETDQVLVVTVHHIASDGWSLPILVKEVVELYSAFVEGRAAVLPALPLQYADYAAWQRKYLDSEMLNKKTGYWKKKLAGVQPLLLPTDFTRPPIRTVHGTSINLMIDKDLTNQLIQLSQQQGTTLFMTLLATYKVMLQRYTAQQDICVGASIANRPQQELEGLIGFFVNTLALRTIIDESETFAGLLQQVKTTTLEAYENQDVPFEKVVEQVVKERDASRTPLFQAMLVLLNTPGAARLGFDEVELSHEAVAINISKFEVTFHISQAAQGLPISIVYNTDLFREDTIIRMGGHFKQLLRSVAQDPQQAIDALQMLTEAEEQQLLAEFN
ncbi:MAG: amino acid adenylation domain-containing protein [Ferruginibacter sp.]